MKIKTKYWPHPSPSPTQAELAVTNVICFFGVGWGWGEVGGWEWGTIELSNYQMYYFLARNCTMEIHPFSLVGEFCQFREYISNTLAWICSPWWFPGGSCLSWNGTWERFWQKGMDGVWKASATREVYKQRTQEDAGCPGEEVALVLKAKMVVGQILTSDFCLRQHC